MSWLSNVASYLEKLDEGAERVVEDRIARGIAGDYVLNDVPEDVQLQSILMARGLSQAGAEEEEEEEDDKEKQEDQAWTEEEQDEDAAYDGKEGEREEFNDFINIQKKTLIVQQQQQEQQATPKYNKNNHSNDVDLVLHEDEEKPSKRMEDLKAEKEGDETEEMGTSGEQIQFENDFPDQVEPPQQDKADQTTAQKESNSSAGMAQEPTLLEFKPPVKSGSGTSTDNNSNNSNNTNTATAFQAMSPTSHAALRESQKEARTLRRYVVSLNKQLEHVETELQAQRVELERAAERLEKDRFRHKEDKEKEKSRHADEIKTLKAQNEKAMKELKLRSDKQVEELRKQLREVEERRMQEGGDWNKELIDAVQREQEMAQKYAVLEDEKATLLSQIAILQDQQQALGNRLESLSQTVDNAMEREHEAEVRLDEALNLHARQIAQRQARESELERTVAELGAALVAARSKSHASLTATAATNGAGAGPGPGKPHSGDTSGASLGNKNRQHDEFSHTSPEARLHALEQDMEGLVAQLNFEKQRSETLQKELRDVSKERTDEITASHSRQVKFDRQVAELSHTIARLEAELRAANIERPAGGAAADSESSTHLRELSEEVLRQREKLAHSHSEISALKSRLKVATERMQTAEAALEAAESRTPDTDEWYPTGDGDGGDLEQAPASGGVRRRGGGIKRSSRRPRDVSLRAALHLDAIRGSKSSEQLGNALDGVDAFLVSSGKFLRYNALARLLFIAYLLLLHVWTFVLIILHAHGFETVHGDFGAGQGAAHGSHALMQEQKPPAVTADGGAAAANVAGEQPLQVEAAGHS